MVYIVNKPLHNVIIYVKKCFHNNFIDNWKLKEIEIFCIEWWENFVWIPKLTTDLRFMSYAFYFLSKFCNSLHKAQFHLYRGC